MILKVKYEIENKFCVYSKWPLPYGISNAPLVKYE